ncbi:MAG: (deoxy)nucleoside triphosphate pyrophosphohydrolase [Synergistes sp.]|nr:(deoxy)nucleoside triphosphate pyrophosphohydrolase [Synergistes sp.]
MSKCTEDAKAVEVVAALIWNDERFMICRRPENKARALLWEFVGGKVEQGETKEEALVRECREELGIEVRPLNIFLDVFHDYPDMNIHLTVFNSKIVSGTPKMIEHCDLKWILPDEICKYDFCPADEAVLAKIRENRD